MQGLCKLALTGIGTGRVGETVQALPAVPSCFEAKLLRVGSTASMKMGTWLPRCTEFKQKDVTCHFLQRVASIPLIMQFTGTVKLLRCQDSKTECRQWLGIRAPPVIIFNGCSTLKSVHFILKPTSPAFLGPLRDPTAVGHCRGQQ